MTAHADRIRQAEQAAGVNDNNPVEVGDILTHPARENLPNKTVMLDRDGDPWQLFGSDWYIPLIMDPGHPSPRFGPYVVVFLPEEDMQ